ncbi:MSMEG_1061 family FMN-dependent PPOX-type flavoprotein [Deinococcus sp. UYEF24]
MTDPHAVQTLDALSTLYPRPSAGVTLKVIDHLDDHLRRALLLSPLCFLATANQGGQLDCSPRGDASSAVQVQDDRTLLLPDRPGNNRLDSLRNIVQNPEVGLIFLLPGVDEVVRVNGVAHVSTDPALLERFSLNGKLPRTVVVVRVREAFMHCPRAFHSAQLWNPERHLKPEQSPDFAAMYEAHKKLNSGG